MSSSAWLTPCMNARKQKKNTLKNKDSQSETWKIKALTKRRSISSRQLFRQRKCRGQINASGTRSPKKLTAGKSLTLTVCIVLMKSVCERCQSLPLSPASLWLKKNASALWLKKWRIELQREAISAEGALSTQTRMSRRSTRETGTSTIS